MIMLRELRKKAGLTQRELAEAVGITEQAIGHYEVGRRNLNVSLAKKKSSTASGGSCMRMMKLRNRRKLLNL